MVEIGADIETLWLNGRYYTEVEVKLAIPMEISAFFYCCVTTVDVM